MVFFMYGMCVKFHLLCILLTQIYYNTSLKKYSTNKDVKKITFRSSRSAVTFQLAPKSVSLYSSMHADRVFKPPSTQIRKKAQWILGSIFTLCNVQKTADYSCLQIKTQKAK